MNVVIVNGIILNMKVNIEATFQLRGFELNLSSEEIKEIVKKLSEAKKGTYIVRIEGKHFAPKDVLYEVIKRKKVNLTKLDFTTQDAIRVLRKLGFDAIEER